MLVFLIDLTGCTEINGEAFAPGFFLRNSEVGKRSVGIQTFWFQAVTCLSGRLKHACDRTDADVKAASLLALAV